MSGAARPGAAASLRAALGAPLGHPGARVVGELVAHLAEIDDDHVVPRAADLDMPTTTTVFVTGGNGFAGANVCQQLIERGDDVRALVRYADDATARSEIGVDLVPGDIADAEDAGTTPTRRPRSARLDGFLPSILQPPPS